ncbi:MAG: S1C family serine protease [Alphaproteobacteria bacterium]|nr:S1C family serine protease [Alphaproteobacteria bacterium]
MRRPIIVLTAAIALAGLSACQTTGRVVETLTPIPVKAQETTKPIAFRKIVSRIPGDKRIGSIGVGVLCVPSTSLFGPGRRQRLDDDRFNDIFRDSLTEANYEVVGDPDRLFGDPDLDRAEYFVAGLVVDAETTGCFPYGGFGIYSSGDGTAFLEVEWQVYDTLRRRVVLELDTQGSGRVEGVRAPMAEATDAAFAAAVANLLADRRFYDLLRTPGPGAAPEGLKGALALTFDANPGVDYDTLKYSVATIRSPNGIGSGFLIEKNLFLTNEHVVGTAKKVRVVLEGGLEVDGRVTSRNPVRDVATVEVEIEGRPLSIATTRPKVGDDVFSIGTPLDEKLAGTLRRGIVSAERRYDNLTFLQADVGLNPGNSGGPLLDNKGNVVGVAVSGVMIFGSQQGLNFFIPIEDALSAIVKEPSQS